MLNMKLYTTLAVIVVACITTPVLPQRWLRQQQQLQQAQYCVTPENYYGSCVTLSYCPQIANVFQVANPRQAQQYIILSQRACNTRSFNGDPVVCCTRPLSVPQTTETPVQPTTPSNPFFSNTRPQRQPPTESPTTSAPTRPPTTVTQPSTTTTTTTDGVSIDNRANECVGVDQRPGTCIPIRQCQILVDELQVKQTDATFANYLRASNKVCGGTATQVCCPSSSDIQIRSTTPGVLIKNSNEIPTRLPTVEEGCGFSNNYFKKIVGGEISRKGAWPWIALLGYNDPVSDSPFKCGGTLVTARHVITASHCLRNDLSFVRLGEHDLSTDTEASHEDIRIVRFEKHPKYNRANGHSDIAILYLERNVEFSPSISPICLPLTKELREVSYLKTSPFVAGWGKTMEGGTPSNVLRELQIKVFDNEFCREKYRTQRRLFTQNQFDDAVLCAGELSGGKDTCQGDSGGPLMLPETYERTSRYYLIGVVSYGIGCARPDIPGVYTRIQYFMDWIIQKVADTP